MACRERGALGCNNPGRSCPKLGRLNRQQDSVPSGAKNNTLQARPARIRILRDSDLSETFGFALNLNRTQLPELGVGCLLRHQHGGSHKLTGNSQPDEILRKENKSRGSRRDSHVPKTMAVKTIRNRGDAAKTAALQSM